MIKTICAISGGAVAMSFCLSASAAYAGYFLPGETMGVSLDSPVPEGVYFADLETYGRADKQPDANVGVNIPVILWSTPWTFGHNRLEVLASFPFAHFDTHTGLAGIDAHANFVSASTWALGPIIARDFGNGLTGGISAFVRSPTVGTALRHADGRTIVEGDFRESLQYTVDTGFLGAMTFMENGGVSSAIGQNYFGSQPGAGLLAPFAKNDTVAGDFTIEKTFDKFTIGFTGFGNIDLDNRGGGRQASAELGGLIGYDFGRLKMTGIFTRTIYENARGVSDTIAGTLSHQGYETRGWLHVIVPLYVAQKVAPAVARY